MDDDVRCGVRVSEFDHSAANHFRAIDQISKLCSEDEEAIDETEIQSLSSSVTFLREWKLFNYEPRDVSFEGVPAPLNLPQFSSAFIPQNEELCGAALSPEPRDFVMYAGGPVWGLDWCPRSHESSDSRGTCEFVAISAHPPGSSYHNLGAPLSGRGLVQIWCVLNIRAASEDISIIEKPKRGRRKSVVKKKEEPNKVKKPRGRPRKYPRKGDVADLDGCGQHMLPLDTRVLENSSPLLAIEGVPSSVQEQNINEHMSGIDGETVLENSGDESLSSMIVRERSRKRSLKEHAAELNSQVIASPSNLLAIEEAPSFITEDSVQENVLEGIADHEANQLVLSQSQPGEEYGESCDISHNSNLDNSSTDRSLPDDVALPRMVLSSAHNGKVAWDVKWRPLNAEDANCKHRMGFLAVVLGNGSLEVWDVPLPHAIKALYSSSDGEGTDPRFVKLKPVFRSSMLKTGGVQSIPLTVEWSAAAPHNFLLAGCHDGTVALWKFSAGESSNDTKPLLRFGADTVPIRVVSWAPVGSESEGENVIVTAGHESLKFWDIRDPFCPLWDIHQGSKSIYGLDWLPNPRCLVLSFDDGTMKVLSLTKAACDVPVTGKPYSGSKQQGLHSYNGSSYAIWSVQVSRLTGMVAYCGADGTVVRFQLTTNAVDRDFSKNRGPHFLCCSLAKEESSIRIDTPATGTSFPLNLHIIRETRQSLRDILFESSPLQRADKKSGNSPASDNQAVALCYDVDPPQEMLASLKKQKPSKSSSVNKKKTDNDLQLAAIDDEPQSKDRKEDERASNKHEALPPKEVAMHRVRWNMNKGCERWLCYGGAAGIVRCHEIVLSEIDLKWAMKK